MNEPLRVLEGGDKRAPQPSPWFANLVLALAIVGALTVGGLIALLVIAFARVVLA